MPERTVSGTLPYVSRSLYRSDRLIWDYPEIELDMPELPTATDTMLRIIRSSETMVLPTDWPPRFSILRELIMLVIATAIGIGVIGIFLMLPIVISVSEVVHGLPSALAIAGGIFVLGEFLVLRVLYGTTRRHKDDWDEGARWR